MLALLNRYATPLITGLFLVSLVSGVALFFHIGQSTFHSMHEILSMVLIVPFVLHLWKNWKPVTAYLKRAPLWIALALSLAISLPFALPSGEPTGRSGPPQMALVQKLMAAPLDTLAPALGTDGASLSAALAAKGFTVTSGAESLASIAKASNRSSEAVVSAALGR